MTWRFNREFVLCKWLSFRFQPLIFRDVGLIGSPLRGSSLAPRKSLKLLGIFGLDDGHLGWQYLSYVAVTYTVYSIYGSGKWQYLKGNYYWRDPFLTSMIMGGSVCKYVSVFIYLYIYIYILDDTSHITCTHFRQNQPLHWNMVQLSPFVFLKETWSFWKDFFRGREHVCINYPIAI